nr:hypothetical protein [uncultured Campylobacter sp.]
MSIIYVCDSCGARSEDDAKIYEFGKDVKEYTGIDEYNHLCRGCFNELNEEKDLRIVGNQIKVKKGDKK